MDTVLKTRIFKELSLAEWICTVLNTRIFKELGLAEWIEYSILGYLKS